MGVVFTCSIDDGNPFDMKTAELLSKHGLSGTFYVPVTNREGFDVMSTCQLRELGRHFEIGSHTHDHCFLNGVDATEANYQIEEGKKELEDLLGTDVLGFCYPRGQYRQRDVDIVRACGFKYARTTMNLRFDAGQKPYEMPTTVQFYPHFRGVYVRNFAKAGHWLKRCNGLQVAMRHENWVARMYGLFDHACERGSIFHLWGHSKDFEDRGAWGDLDRFLGYVATRVAAADRLNNMQLANRFYMTPGKYRYVEPEMVHGNAENWR